tara:strand:- start:8451 stop:9035 length:585 start_codon:yes stop_codon:yes gene_type:complete
MPPLPNMTVLSLNPSVDVGDGGVTDMLIVEEEGLQKKIDEMNKTILEITNNYTLKLLASFSKEWGGERKRQKGPGGNPVTLNTTDTFKESFEARLTWSNEWKNYMFFRLDYELFLSNFYKEYKRNPMKRMQQKNEEIKWLDSFLLKLQEHVKNLNNRTCVKDQFIAECDWLKIRTEKIKEQKEKLEAGEVEEID